MLGRLYSNRSKCKAEYRNVLLDFTLTVKAATIIFISGRGSAISSARQVNSGFFMIWYSANVRAFHENLNRIHTEITFINP